MHIAVVGSTGVLGRHVVPRLLERGHKVRALVRREKQAAMFRRVGVEPVLGDILKIDTLVQATQGCDAALHLATAIPKGKDLDWSMNDRIRREGTQNLLTAAAQNGLHRYIQQSVILVYGDHAAQIVDETASLQPGAVLQSAVDMENYVKASDLDWCILRGGLFYGPGTGRDEAWRQAALDKTLRLPGQGDGLISLIHVVDMARAIIDAVENASADSIFNVVDDEPVRYRDLYQYVAALVDGPDAEVGGPTVLPSLGCSNEKLRSELNWAPLYPSYHSGLSY